MDDPQRRRHHRFIPVSDETGITLVGTYNAASAADPHIPYKWRLFYGIRRPRTSPAASPRPAGRPSSAIGCVPGPRYISAHPSSPLQAGYHNLLRMLELEGSDAWHASAAAVGLSVATARRGVIGFWIIAVLALAGLFTRAARASRDGCGASRR